MSQAAFTNKYTLGSDLLTTRSTNYLPIVPRYNFYKPLRATLRIVPTRSTALQPNNQINFQIQRSRMQSEL